MSYQRTPPDPGTLFSELKNLSVWNKSNGGMGSFYRSKHELGWRREFKARRIKNFEASELFSAGLERINGLVNGQTCARTSGGMPIPCRSPTGVLFVSL